MDDIILDPKTELTVRFIPLTSTKMGMMAYERGVLLPMSEMEVLEHSTADGMSYPLPPCVWNKVDMYLLSLHAHYTVSCKRRPFSLHSNTSFRVDVWENK